MDNLNTVGKNDNNGTAEKSDFHQGTQPFIEPAAVQDMQTPGMLYETLVEERERNTNSDTFSAPKQGNKAPYEDFERMERVFHNTGMQNSGGGFPYPQGDFCGSQPYSQPYGQPYNQPYSQPYNQPYAEEYNRAYGEGHRMSPEGAGHSEPVFPDSLIFQNLPDPYGSSGWRGFASDQNMQNNWAPYGMYFPYAVQGCQPENQRGFQRKREKIRNNGLMVFFAVVGVIFIFLAAVFVVLVQANRSDSGSYRTGFGSLYAAEELKQEAYEAVQLHWEQRE